MNGYLMLDWLLGCRGGFGRIMKTFKMINPSHYPVGKFCHEIDAKYVGVNTPRFGMLKLSFQFFQLPSPLWKPAIALRYEVFVFEQKVPEEMEVDTHDATAHHMLVQDDNQNCVGVMRIVVKGNVGKIGRVAVARDYRRQRVGTEMMVKAVAYCRSLKLESVALDSQSYVTSFYERLGFVQEGDEFMDAGIPHVHMSRAIRP